MPMDAKSAMPCLARRTPVRVFRLRSATWTVRSGVVLASLVILALAGCAAPAATTITSVPTAAATSSLPSIAASSFAIDSGLTGTACLDASTYAVIQQLKVPGADIQGILTTSKDQLLIGLAAMQPRDDVSASWRDFMTSSLSSGNMADAIGYVAYLTSGEVIITKC